MWDDFYEPGEFDEVIEEFKASIVDNVKQEIKDKIDRLEKENADLREIRDNWQQIKNEHDRMMRDLRLEKENAKKQAEKARLQTVFRELCVTAYRPSYKFLQGPKCDKCDDARKIHFVSPMGRQMQEDCVCAASKPFYSPREELLFSFYVGEKLGSRYYTKEDYPDADRYDCVADVYQELPDDLESINKYRAVFLTAEDCQSYCDWHNRKNGLLPEPPKEE